MRASANNTPQNLQMAAPAVVRASTDSKPHIHQMAAPAVVRASGDNIPPGGGGGTQVQRKAAPLLHISRKKGSFLRPPYVRDVVKEGYIFVPSYEVCRLKIPLQSMKYMRL